jgi:hypothetical protein
MRVSRVKNSTQVYLPSIPDFRGSKALQGGRKQLYQRNNLFRALLEDEGDQGLPIVRGAEARAILANYKPLIGQVCAGDSTDMNWYPREIVWNSGPWKIDENKEADQ